MKIEMLGSGSIFSTHPSSSMIIDKKILIDAPSGIVKEIIKKEMDFINIDICIITHFHADHYFDIPALLLKKYYSVKNMLDSNDENVSVNKNLLIIGPEGIEEKVNLLLEMAFEEQKEEILSILKVAYIESEDYAKIMLNKDLIVTSVEVNHTKETKSYGYIVEVNGKKVGFTGDTSLCDGVMKIVEDADVTFLDTTRLDGTESHMGINDVFKIADGFKMRKFIATHMNDETREKLELRIKERNDNKINVQVGNEDLIIEL